MLDLVQLASINNFIKNIYIHIIWQQQHAFCLGEQMTGKIRDNLRKDPALTCWAVGDGPPAAPSSPAEIAADGISPALPLSACSHLCSVWSSLGAPPWSSPAHSPPWLLKQKTFEVTLTFYLIKKDSLLCNCVQEMNVVGCWVDSQILCFTFGCGETLTWTFNVAYVRSAIKLPVLHSTNFQIFYHRLSASILPDDQISSFCQYRLCFYRFNVSTALQVNTYHKNS